MNKTEFKTALRNMNLMTVDEVKEKMGDAKDVTLRFYKMDGTIREMNCTRNFKWLKEEGWLTDYVEPNGNGLNYDNTLHKLVTVWEHGVGFKQVPANRMLRVIVD